MEVSAQNAWRGNFHVPSSKPFAAPVLRGVQPQRSRHFHVAKRMVESTSHIPMDLMSDQSPTRASHKLNSPHCSSCATKTLPEHQHPHRFSLTALFVCIWLSEAQIEGVSAQHYCTVLQRLELVQGALSLQQRIRLTRIRSCSFRSLVAFPLDHRHRLLRIDL